MSGHTQKDGGDLLSSMLLLPGCFWEDLLSSSGRSLRGWLSEQLRLDALYDLGRFHCPYTSRASPGSG